jgi:hypothetical protein
MPERHTPAEWLMMADHARVVADNQCESTSKRRMTQIAEAYEAMASYAALVAVARLCGEGDCEETACQIW